MVIRGMVRSLLVTAVLPALMFSVLGQIHTQRQSQKKETQNETGKRMQTVLRVPVQLHAGEIVEMDLEQYVMNVILAEASPDFEEEALKALAVAVRTYTLRNMEESNKHIGAAVCTDYRCCQSYIEPEAYCSAGGNPKHITRVQKAVTETWGEVVLYGEELICATYFSSSGGMTEDAQQVWGEVYPYLKSVESPGEEQCDAFTKQTVLTPEELQQRLGIKLSGEPSSWFGVVIYTQSGSVDLMRIGGRLYTGVELRKMLGLRSTMFKVLFEDGKIIFDTRGYGHRVGLSQHGANAMAVKGMDYRQILMHYYSGVSLAEYPPDGD